jgi:PAS domain S-box-containing protein
LSTNCGTITIASWQDALGWRRPPENAAMLEDDRLSDGALHSHHDPWLVALSIAVAILASFAALDLAGRVRETRGQAQAGWWLAGSVAMGGGIWSMHFVAMLAFQLGMVVTYDVWTTVLSLVIAIVVSGFGLFIVFHRHGTWPAILGGGVLAGIGIVAMHYTGMAAMRMAAHLSYDPFLFGLSIVIAIAAATAALWLALRPQRLWQQLGSAVVMGAAITGMHYTGMAAARFEPLAAAEPIIANGLSNAYLAAGVAGTTAVLLGLALTATFMDRRFARAQREARIIEASEARYRRIFDTAAVSIWDEDFSTVVDALDALRVQGVTDFRRHFDEHPEFVARAAELVRVRDVNQATLELFEARDKAELLGSLDRVFLPETLGVFREELLAIAERAPFFKGTAPARTLGGRRIEIILSMVFSPDDPRLGNVLVSILDVSELKRAEEALRQSEARLRLSEERHRHVVDLIQEAIWIHRDGTIVFANPAAAKLFGAPAPDALLGKSIFSLFHADDLPRAIERTRITVREGRPVPVIDMRMIGLDGKTRIAAIHAIPIVQDGHVHTMASARDVTAQREAEAQLHQAQKIESVGQLTGGIAHDFNNLLTVVIGSLDSVVERVQSDLRPSIDSALRAAERGATLIRQMLAFSRRQTLVPEALNLNDLAAGMEDLLRRTLGEQIEIEMRLSSELWPTLADKGQVENALLNLTINSRDAMPAGGKLTIETTNTHLDQEYAGHNAEVTAGDYVVLAVTDTGGGMPPDVLARALEPFFTTKEVGKGSGLGLSMIYGFAKQSGGHLKIYSEVDHGTTVRLYLPRQAPAAAAVAAATASASDHPRGGETILVVEDDPLVRNFVVSQLRDLGYAVLEATDGPAAEKLLEDGASIDLLFTDVVMPGGLTGRQLAEKAKRRRIGLKTLYTSGYTEDSIVHHGKLDPGVHFLSKPFRRQDLAAKVREALDAAP